MKDVASKGQGKGKGFDALGQSRVKSDVPFEYRVNYRQSQESPDPPGPSEGDIIERSLEENRFWLRIMKEHSFFLSEAFDRRNSDLIRRANQFFRDFDQLLTEAEALQPRTPEQMVEFNERAIVRAADLRNFKQEVLVLIITGRIAGFNLPLLVDHIRREAEKFLSVLDMIERRINRTFEPVQAFSPTEPAPPCENIGL